MNHLLIYTDDSGTYHELLTQRQLPDLSMVPCADADNARRVIGSCNIVLGDPPLAAGILSHARGLQWVQSSYAGVDAFCAGGLRRDYILTGIKEVFGPLMSEYVFAYILAIERHLFKTKENQDAGSWVKVPYRSLKGLTFGVCGLGSIGRHLARTAAHFGMRAVAYKRTPGKAPDLERIFSGAEFYEFVGALDYLVLVLPHTPDTAGLVNLNALKKMKPSAVLINIGRGSAVVESDLVFALENRLIKAAVLDVFEKEPLPADSALWKIPNVYITPHNAGISFPRDVVNIFCENYLRFIDNKPLKYVIGFQKGY